MPSSSWACSSRPAPSLMATKPWPCHPLGESGHKVRWVAIRCTRPTKESGWHALVFVGMFFKASALPHGHEAVAMPPALQEERREWTRGRRRVDRIQGIGMIRSDEGPLRCPF
jgi:hypothetical protein